MEAYIAISDADMYMLSRVFSDAWTNSADDKKQQAILHATRIIDDLSFKGRKATTAQQLRWPRIMQEGADPILPQGILDACCEIALALISGIDPEKEFRNLTRTSGGYGSLRHSKDTTMVEPHFAAGVPSISAWNKLLPWLTDIYSVKILRK